MGLKAINMMSKAVGAMGLKKPIITRNAMLTKQTINGVSSVSGDLYKEGILLEYAKVSKGSDFVSRMAERCKFTMVGDVTKVVKNEIAEVGNKSVRTRKEGVYKYFDDGLGIIKTQIDRVFAGRRHLGGRAVITEIPESSTKPIRTFKDFFDKDGKILKTVHFDPETGLRKRTQFADGTVLEFDKKGLPTFSKNYPGINVNAMLNALG